MLYCTTVPVPVAGRSYTTGTGTSSRGTGRYHPVPVLGADFKPPQVFEAVFRLLCARMLDPIRGLFAMFRSQSDNLKKKHAWRGAAAAASRILQGW